MASKENNLSGYKAVILAGGKGTRLYPVTLRIPKPLLPIGKKPMVNHIIDHLMKFGIKDVAVLINTSQKKDFYQWKKTYYFSKNIKIFEEKIPLGTFGGLWHVKKWLEGKRFFLVNGDDLTNLNINKLAKFAERNDFIGSLALVMVKNPKDYGVVVKNGNRIGKFIEKSENLLSSYVNSGWYVLSYKIFDYHPGPVFSMIEKDIFPALAKNKKLGGLSYVCKWIDCGTWERYQRAIKIFGKK